MNNEREISLRECIQVLSLFFILSVRSVLLLYTKFEEGIEDFWSEREEYMDVFENEILGDIIDLDNIENMEDVSVINKNEMTEEYINSKGEVRVFNKIFENYFTEE